MVPVVRAAVRGNKTRRYIGVPFRVDGFFSLFFALIFDWFQLYIFAVTSCIVHCVTCFFYINLRLSFPTKIETPTQNLNHAPRETGHLRSAGEIGEADDSPCWVVKLCKKWGFDGTFFVNPANFRHVAVK